jgi:glycerate kinase
MRFDTPGTRALIASAPFGALGAEQVAASIARGLVSGGMPDPDVLALDGDTADVGKLLAECDFDARMRAARAVIIAVQRLREETLAGSAAFEIATRARQSGVPSYAITAENRLDAFDTRILDLQTILEAENPRALAAAGRKLAKLL